jgi:hypothetical protein
MLNSKWLFSLRSQSVMAEAIACGIFGSRHHTKKAKKELLVHQT